MNKVKHETLQRNVDFKKKQEDSSYEIKQEQLARDQEYQRLQVEYSTN